ncbi:MAG TPA: ComEC/Rec2 family competence protein [Pseudonocardiaceae bacterium]|jgi:competence protein ComEC|nr:ComEC/Rec2 family competence protein [Pseudonocardiaceae bacterium]
MTAPEPTDQTTGPGLGDRTASPEPGGRVSGPDPDEDRPPWWRRLLARHDLRLLPAAAAVWAATVLGQRIAWPWTVALGLATVLCGLSVLLALRGKPGREVGDLRVAAVALLLSGLAVALFTGARLRHDAANPLHELATNQAAVTLRVELDEVPRPIASPGFAARPGGVRSVVVQAEVVRLGRAPRARPADGAVLLIAPVRGWSGLLPGQQADATGQFAPPHPGDTVLAVVLIRGPPRQISPAGPVARAAHALRAGLATASAGLPGDSRGLLPALVDGDRGGLRQPVLDDFQLAGMAYLTAVGGYHFMIVCGAVLWLLRRLSLGPRSRAVLAGLALLAFGEVAGGAPNVRRAALMVAVGLLALATGRARSAGSALAATVIVLTLWHPDYASDIGFALSVAATAGMVAGAGGVAAALRRCGVPGGIAEVLAVALVANLVTAPLIAAAYGQLGLVCVGANALAEPAFPPAMLLGVLAMASAPVCPPLAAVLTHLALPATWWLLFVAHHAAALPAATLPWPSGWLGGAALAALLLIVVVAWRSRRLRALMIAALAGVFLVLVPVRVIAPGWPPDGWVLVDCDVGQGDGEVLATAEPGRAIVVDTGPDEQAMDECLGRLHVTRIPLLVLSHLHADHVGGLDTVLHDRSVGAVAVGPSRVPAWSWDQVRRETGAAGVPLVELTVGQRLSWPGLVLDVLGPPPAESWPTGDDPSGTVVNNSSLVLRATTRAGRVLLTGDVELAAQADLLNSTMDLRADILKIPHHGSRYSAPSFLDAVHARVAVASVGAGNPYGHPSPLTLNRLTADGALVLRTDHDGDVAVLPGPTGPLVVRRGDPRPAPHGATPHGRKS